MQMYVNDNNGYYPQSCVIGGTIRTIWTTNLPRTYSVTYIAPYLNYSKNIHVAWVRIKRIISPLACPDFDQSPYTAGDFPSYLHNCHLLSHCSIYNTIRNIKNTYRPSRTMMSMDTLGHKNGDGYCYTKPSENFAYRHGGASNVLFIDGRVVTLKKTQIPQAGATDEPGYHQRANKSYFWQPEYQNDFIDLGTY